MMGSAIVRRLANGGCEILVADRQTLTPTNGCAVAKIAAIKLCESYRRRMGRAGRLVFS
jgi:hypothetical protein